MNSDNESQIKDAQRMRMFLNQAIDRAKRTCFNCASFKEPNLWCMQHNGNPPPRVVAFGCDNYVPSDEIPY